MNHLQIADELNRNLEVFRGLFRGADQQVYLWRPSPEKWCMLEVLCHLLDEERRRDFPRQTVKLRRMPAPQHGELDERG